MNAFLALVALAGAHVLGGVNAQQPQVLLDGNVAWTAPVVPVPSVDRPGFDLSVEQRLTALRASATTAVFVRSAWLVLAPKCGKATPPCLAAIQLQPLRGDLYVGSPAGPFRQVRLRARAVAVDVSGSAVLAATSAHRIVLIRPRAPLLLVEAAPRPVTAVALAGRYAAWAEGTDGRPTVTLYDLHARRPLFTLRAAALHAGYVYSLDVGADGAVAFVTDDVAAGHCYQGLGWASPSAPKPHMLAVDAAQASVRVAGGRIAFATAGCDGRSIAYETTDRAGHVARVAASSQLGDFDFDGRRLAYVDSGAVRVVTAP